MCLEYVQFVKSYDDCTYLVLARPSFPGKCVGEMGGSEVYWRGWGCCQGKCLGEVIQVVICLRKYVGELWGWSSLGVWMSLWTSRQGRKLC